MAHVTFAASQDTVQQLFDQVRGNIHAATSGNTGGSLQASWDFAFRLENGTVHLQPNASNAIVVTDLDVIYDPALAQITLDIPEICFGGNCLLRVFGTCIIQSPTVCLFSSDSDFELGIDLSGLASDIVSAAFTIEPRYFVNPGRTPGMTDHEALEADVSDRWQFFLDVTPPLQLNLIDPASAGAVVEQAITNLAANILAGLSPVERAIMNWLLVPLIRQQLNLGTSSSVWLTNLITNEIGLLNFVALQVADHFANKSPLHQVNNPIRLLTDPSGNLIPVLLPLEDISLQVGDSELILAIDILEAT